MSEMKTETYDIAIIGGGPAGLIAAAVAAETGARVIVLEKTGSFGTKRPHSLWARIEPAQALIDLQAELERRLQRLGFEPDGRKFIPHVTLARLRSASASDTANWLAMRGEVTTVRFSANRFVLFSSRASKGGGPYLVEESYPLAA